MFGTYRFILAALVALSHFGMTVAGFNPGQWSVICFYTLSGLLMERQFHKLSKDGNGTAAFYLDRFFRIYPLFLVVLLIASVGSQISSVAMAANVTLLPLNYSSLLNIPMLIGPSWSLACEVHFYLLVPLLAFLPTKTVRPVLVVSLCIFAASSFLPNSSFWAYTALPGILFTFLSGILINRKDYHFIKIICLVMLFLLIAFGLTKYFHAGLRTGIHVNVAIGYLIAVVATICLDKLSPNVKWDRFLGLFSYPLFLCHGTVAEFSRRFWHVWNPLELLFASVLFAWILILIVEIPFDHLRYRLRRRVAPQNLEKAETSQN